MTVFGCEVISTATGAGRFTVSVTEAIACANRTWNSASGDVLVFAVCRIPSLGVQAQARRASMAIANIKVRADGEYQACIGRIDAVESAGNAPLAPRPTSRGGQY